MSIYSASIDDNDPAVVWSGGWELITKDPTWNWTGTMHSTNKIGAFGRVRFTGSRVAVICTIATGNGPPSQGTFSIDDGPAQYAAHPTMPPVQWHYVFWDSGPLPFADHLLTISNAGNTAWFRVDSIDYDPTDGHAPKSSSVATSPTQAAPVALASPNAPSALAQSNTPIANTSTSASNSSSGPLSMSPSVRTVLSTATIVDPSSSSSPQPPLADGSRNSNTGGQPGPVHADGQTKAAMIGGIVAGIFAVLVMVALVLLILRHRRRRYDNMEEEKAEPPSPVSSSTFASFIGGSHNSILVPRPFAPMRPASYGTPDSPFLSSSQEKIAINSRMANDQRYLVSLSSGEMSPSETSISNPRISGPMQPHASTSRHSRNPSYSNHSESIYTSGSGSRPHDDSGASNGPPRPVVSDTQLDAEDAPPAYS